MKQTISLNGAWQLAGLDGGKEVEAHVPGEVHVDLHRAGVILDPYYAMNANDAQWIEEKEWRYKRGFDVEEDFLQQKAFLEFDGLDTLATIFLNDQEIGKAANRFVPHRFDVTGIVREGPNTVEVSFEPIGETHCACGSDWTHRFAGAGIRRDARLVSCDTLSIANVHVEPEIVGSYADAWIAIEVENHTGEDQRATASIVIALGENRERIEVTETISPFGGVIETVIRIEEPRLWWPNGFGEQPLYSCMVGLQSEGEVLDVTERTFGVRTVGFVERDESGSNALTLLVNGEEVFCKGANWVPADRFVSNVTPERCRELVQLAKDANFNMLRVCGGGVYEPPAFYEACDEMGVMVWQEVADEAEAVVKRLRNHPSIMVWCGNEVIPNVLKRLDHTRPYRPSSPLGGETGNDPTEGDPTRWRHLIEEARAPFVSEFHASGSPEIESLKEFIPEEELYPPTNEVWEFHNTGNPHFGRTDGLTHQQILIDLTRRMMGEFNSAEEFAVYSGILQGEFVKAEFEHFRREKWAISGALYWTFNDSWPAIGCSLVDYFLRPKPAYYYAKRACAPVILSFKQLEDRVQLYVTSDSRQRGVEGTMRVGLLTFETCGFDTQDFAVRLTANTSRALWESEPLEGLFSDPTRQCLVALLESRGKVIAKATYFPRLFAEMQFPGPKLLVDREQMTETRHRIGMAANAYARNVAITNLPASARPSDNYFDLLPGEAYEVMIDGLTVEEANELGISVWRR